MAKLKIFKFEDKIGQSEEISKFIESVGVIENGLLLADGTLGVLYKERGDVGLAKTDMVTPASAELGKAQKQFILQEGLFRAYTEMVVMFENKDKAIQVKIDEAENELASLKSPAVPELLAEKISTIALKIEGIKKTFKQKKGAEKEKALKDVLALEEALKPLQEEVAEIKSKHEASVTEIKDRINKLKADKVNNQGKIKENKEMLENAVEDREHASVFIRTTTKLIKDIVAADLDENNHLKFKE